VRLTISILIVNRTYGHQPPTILYLSALYSILYSTCMQVQYTAGRRTLMPRLITHKRSPQGNTTIFLHSSLHCNLLLSRWSYRSIWIPMSRILTISRKVSISYSHPFLRLPASSWSSCSIIHGAILVTLRIWIRNNQKLRRSPKPTATVGEKRRCNRVCLN